AAVRRRAVRQRIEQKPELRTRARFRDSQHGENSLLHLWSMNSDRSTAELVPVEHHVVSLSPHALGSALEERQVLVPRRGERMMYGSPPLLLDAPFKERKVGDPQEAPTRTIDEPELVPELQPKQPRRLGGHALFVGHQEQQIADLEPGSGLGASLFIVREELRDGRLPAVRVDPDPYETLGSQARRRGHEVVQVLPREPLSGNLQTAHHSASLERFAENLEAGA